MDLTFSPQDLAFQQQVREFLALHLPAHIIAATNNNSSVFLEKELALEWQAILVKQGWAVPQWPSEHGGCDWSPSQKYIFSKECYQAGAPMLIPLGLLMLAPVIMAFGSEEQKQTYLPKILSGEHYPEPDLIWLASNSGQSPRATTISSTARKSGPPTPILQTIYSAWCARITAADRNRESASC